MRKITLTTDEIDELTQAMANLVECLAKNEKLLNILAKSLKPAEVLGAIALIGAETAADLFIVNYSETQPELIFAAVDSALRKSQPDNGGCPVDTKPSASIGDALLWDDWATAFKAAVCATLGTENEKSERDDDKSL